jgi:hypothetical protein
VPHKQLPAVLRLLSIVALVIGCADDPAQPGFSVSVSAKPSEGGTVTGAGRFSRGSTVTLEATPALGYTFGGWLRDDRLDLVALTSRYSFVDSVDHSFDAIFYANPKPSVARPRAYEIAGDSVRVSVLTPRLIVQVRASVGATTADLRYAGPDDGFVAYLRLVGQPLDTIPISVVTTDSSGANTTIVVPIIHDAPPTVTVAMPGQSSVARPTVGYSLSCTDDHPGCVVSVEEFDREVFASGQQSISGALSFANRDGTQLLLGLSAIDSRGQRTRVGRLVYVETSPNLDSVTSARMDIWDFDVTRVLFGSLPSNNQLIIKQIATGQEEVVTPLADVNWGSLTSVGALASYAPRTMIDWRGGQTTTVNGLIADAADPYAVIVAGDGGIARYDVNTRTSVMITKLPRISTNPYDRFAAVAANGDVVVSGAAKTLLRYRGGTLAPLPGEPASDLVDTLPLTDGNIVVYRKTLTTPTGGRVHQMAMNDGFAEVLLGAARTAPAPVDPFFGALPKRDYDLSAGWVAFTANDAGGVLQVWLRSPAGAIRQISNTTSAATISAVGPDGTVLFISRGRRYLCPPGGVPRDIMSAQGKVVFRGTQPFLMLGSTLWRIR